MTPGKSVHHLLAFACSKDLKIVSYDGTMNE